ncbi:MAG: VOC family protein [Methanomicrobiales archaeon]|jgi:PhnB protein|nr:VOC family protein [Methanomicrobiales archaeon]
MLIEMFLVFDGDCREAVEFYAKVFKTDVNSLMTYEQMPPDPSYTVPEADRDKVMYASIQFDNALIMCTDIPSGETLTKGNNIIPTVSSEDKDEVRRIFNELKDGGTVGMDLQKTFYSELYGMVTDKFGIVWNILHYTYE